MPKLASTFVCLALLIAACTPADEVQPTTTVANGVPVPSTTSSTLSLPPDGFGGHISVGIDATLTTLNPFDPGALEAARIVGNAVWATVYDIDPLTWERIPDNVTALPTSYDGGIKANADGTMTVQYQVARRATWSDGVPMTGADLAFTAEAMRDLASAGNPNVDPVMASVVSTDSVDQIAWVTFAEPSLSFEDALWIILPSHALAGTDIATSDAATWPSGGPFRVEGGDLMSLVRNPNYWKSDEAGRQLPYVDSISFVESGDDPVELFANRVVDVTQLPETADAVSRVADLEPDGAELQVAATPFMEHVTFNFGEGRAVANEASFNDEFSFRAAIARSIDRETLLASTGVPWSAAIPGLLIPLGPSAFDRYPFNSTESRSLVSSLEAVNEPRSVLSTTINDADRPLLAAELASAFAPIGVAYETNLMDSLVFFNDVLPSGTYDLGMWAWENDGGYGQTMKLLEFFDPTNVPGSYSSWGSAANADALARYSEIVIEARITFDADQFEELVGEAEEILAAELPLIPLFHRSSHAAFWSDVVTGVTHNGSRSGLTWNVELWQVNGE
jgi:ABC-type transport system substrate-binding protein